MPNIKTIVRQINKDLVPQFETKLREVLVAQDRQWLIEQIVRLTLDAHSPHEMDRWTLQDNKAAKRREHVLRVRELGFERDTLTAFLEQVASVGRELLIAGGYLLDPAAARRQCGRGPHGPPRWRENDTGRPGQGLPRSARRMRSQPISSGGGHSVKSARRGLLPVG